MRSSSMMRRSTSGGGQCSAGPLSCLSTSSGPGLISPPTSRSSSVTSCQLDPKLRLPRPSPMPNKPKPQPRPRPEPPRAFLWISDPRPNPNPSPSPKPSTASRLRQVSRVPRSSKQRQSHLLALASASGAGWRSAWRRCRFRSQPRMMMELSGRGLTMVFGRDSDSERTSTADHELRPKLSRLGASLSDRSVAASESTSSCPSCMRRRCRST
mmetsp:Transcript_39966/g.125049  ORF Transcript_39966/g.125049 Transcript_39966/m.125049 type:complete len:212 (+) Transcript_39966:640-1275(+)